MNLVFKYRIKDSKAHKILDKMSSSVNYVWNYCNETALKCFKRDYRFITGFELSNLTAGSGPELGLHSQTIQKIGEELCKKRKQFKKIRLRFRTRKRNLPWIPVSHQSIRFNKETGTVRFFGKHYKTWHSREIPKNVKLVDGCSFNCDSTGKWFFSLCLEVPENQAVKSDQPIVGIDLGLKTQLSLSDGTKYKRENLTKRFEDRLAKAQRAKKKKQTSNLHTKIKNVRKDWTHKVTTALIGLYSAVFVGNVNSSALAKTNLSKSVYDASWFELKRLLDYKARKLGKRFLEINEAYSTVTCSSCFNKTGPKGIAELNIREWVCCDCNSIHDRDTNAAKNILRFGHETLTKGIPGL